MKWRIRKDDLVVALNGASKGQSGRVLAVDRQRGRVYVEGLNMRRSARRRSQASPQGGFVDKEGPIHISNVMLQEKYEERQKARVPSKSEEKED